MAVPAVLILRRSRAGKKKEIDLRRCLMKSESDNAVVNPDKRVRTRRNLTSDKLRHSSKTADDGVKRNGISRTRADNEFANEKDIPWSRMADFHCRCEAAVEFARCTMIDRLGLSLHNPLGSRLEIGSGPAALPLHNQDKDCSLLGLSSIFPFRILQAGRERPPLRVRSRRNTGTATKIRLAGALRRRLTWKADLCKQIEAASGRPDCRPLFRLIKAHDLN